MTDTRTPDLLDVLRHTDTYEWPELPDGHVWGWRSITADHRTRDGFRWPWPGGVAVAPDDGRDLAPDTAPDEPCPSDTLGGLCIAKTWGGARSGGTPAQIGLLVAYRPEGVLGEDGDKRRVSRCVVLDVIDLTKANLTGANLRGADLYGANLTGANLRGADLYGANLYEANLRGANLYEANLGGANLRGANLTRADLYEANLDGAYLYEANLRGADLYGANLRGADLYGAERWMDDPPIPGWTRSDHGTLTREVAE